MQLFKILWQSSCSICSVYNHAQFETVPHLISAVLYLALWILTHLNVITFRDAECAHFFFLPLSKSAYFIKPWKLLISCSGMCLYAFACLCRLSIQLISNEKILFVCLWTWNLNGYKILFLFLRPYLFSLPSLFESFNLLFFFAFHSLFFCLSSEMWSHFFFSVTLCRLHVSVCLYLFLNTLSFSHFSAAAACSHSDPLCCWHTNQGAHTHMHVPRLM